MSAVVSAVGGNVGNSVVPAVGFNVDVGDDVGGAVVSTVGENVGNSVVLAVGFNVDVGDDVGNSVSVVLIVLSVGASVSSSLEFEEYPTQFVSPPSQSASTSKGRDVI